MKQIDNRQKQQIFLKAQKSGLAKHSVNPKEKSDVPEGGEKSAGPEKKIEPYHAGPKVGRNDPCPCGSGLKYKKCCLAKETE